MQHVSFNDIFPPVELADEEGVLAIGIKLSTERLKIAYRKGIFPWYSGNIPVWYAPQPRFVLFPNEVKISKSLRQTLRKNEFEVQFNTDFEQILCHCRDVKRVGQEGDSWITPALFRCLKELHQEGIAVSVAVYQQGKLVGGLYGELFGKVFFGESMFALTSNASKVAFATCVQNMSEAGVKVIDCQVYTEYLESFGACMIDRKDFTFLLNEYFDAAPIVKQIKDNWHSYSF